VIEKSRQSRIGQKRSDATRKKLSEARQTNIEKANETIRHKAGRSASGYKGVYQKGAKWQAKFNLHGNDTNIGTFVTKEEAAHHYDYFMLKNYEQPYLNFPEFDYSSFVPNTPKPSRKLDFKKAKEIRDQHKNGQSPKELAQKYGVSLTNIYRVLNEIYYPKTSAIVSVIYNPH